MAKKKKPQRAQGPKSKRVPATPVGGSADEDVSAASREAEEQTATDADMSSERPEKEVVEVVAAPLIEPKEFTLNADPVEEGPKPTHAPLVGAPWARPLVTLDKWWTWFEWRFLFVVLAALIFLAVSWVALGGLAAPVPKNYGDLSWLKRIKESGGAFRALFGFAVLGGIARLATRKLSTRNRTIVTAVAIAAGIFLAPVWRGTFVEYADNWKKFLQSGSSFTMFGGLRGTMSRTTILLAMLGASLAAASGKHIYIDVVQRFVKPGWRKLMFAASTAITIGVCLVASWGFLDYISIESFGAKITWNANQRMTHMRREVAKDLFLWRTQVGLDFKAFPHVLGGGKWDDPDRMNGRQWNEFLEKEGFREHYKSADVDELMAKDSQLDKPWQPQVYKPPHGQPLNLLVHALNLLFPFGLFMVGLRFLLRLVLVLTDHLPVEAEAEEYAGAKSTAEDLEARADKAMEDRKSAPPMDDSEKAEEDDEKPDDEKPDDEESDGEKADDEKADDEKADDEKPDDEKPGDEKSDDDKEKA